MLRPRSPLAGEGGGAGAAAHRVHPSQCSPQGGGVAQVGDRGGQPLRAAKLLLHLLCAAAEGAHLVAPLRICRDGAAAAKSAAGGRSDARKRGGGRVSGVRMHRRAAGMCEPPFCCSHLKQLCCQQLADASSCPRDKHSRPRLLLKEGGAKQCVGAVGTGGNAVERERRQRQRHRESLATQPGSPPALNCSPRPLLRRAARQDAAPLLTCSEGAAGQVCQLLQRTGGPLQAVGNQRTWLQAAGELRALGAASAQRWRPWRRLKQHKSCVWRQKRVKWRQEGDERRRKHFFLDLMTFVHRAPRLNSRAPN